MPAASTGLARVTISSPQRRVDVALPDSVPIAEVLPELLRHAGEGLADDGERHGGWLLRRGDGLALAQTASLAAQEVRDGAVLYLAPARAEWPELEYDDVVEAIAAGARRQGAGWSGSATRATGLAAAGLTLSLSLLAVWFSGPTRQHAAFVALVGAALLVISGVIAARAYGDAVVGAALAGFALPFSFVGGLLVLVPDVPVAELSRTERVSFLLVGSVTLLLVSLIGAVGVAHLLRLFVAGATIGVVGILGSLVGYPASPAGAGAIGLAVLISTVAVIPMLAIRLGKLPMPVLSLPTDLSRSGRGLAAPPDRESVFAAVARTDEMLTGLLLGFAVASVAASFVVASTGGLAGWLLVGTAAGSLLLRARLFITVRHRMPLLGAGYLGLFLLASGLVRAGEPGANMIVALALAGAGLIVAIMATRYATLEPSPYLGRTADILDAICVISVIPLACWVLGLFGMARAVLG